MGLEKILQQENIIDENTIQDSYCPTHCSQLWMSIKLVEILKIEKLQRDFMNRIPALRGNNYWAKLKILKMTSLQRRQERMIYIWKIQYPYLIWRISLGEPSKICFGNTWNFVLTRGAGVRPNPKFF